MKSVSNILKVVKNFKTENEAIQFFIKQRWNGKVECPFGTCSAESKIYNLKSGKDFKCSCCGKIFSYKTRTIFEDTKIPMRKWFMAIYLIVNHKKGISSLQLGRDIDVTQKTAWFMLHRIRHILGLDDDNMFDGTTECDEVYLGGKEGNKHASKKNIAEKTVVVGMVNRETGKAKATVVESNKSYELQEVIYNNIKEGSNIVTDSYSGYDCLDWNYKHESVKHSVGEYVKESSRVSFKIHTNTVEGMFSHLKRTILGTYHWISKKHTNAYLQEVSFRYSTRKISDEFRLVSLLKSTQGRLTYKTLIA
jgi:transposase-like protein